MQPAFAACLPSGGVRAAVLHRTAWLSTVSDPLPRLSLRAFAPPTKRPVRRARRIVSETGTPPTRIAVVGAGLAGLSVAYHLLHSTRRVAKKRDLDHTHIRVTVFDPADPGTAGGTRVAAGLLHPFTPRVKKKAWHAKKAVPGALHLIEQAQPFARDGPLVRACGVLRPALDERAAADHVVAARRYPSEVELWDAERVRAECAGVAAERGGAFLRQAVVVDTQRYARALAQAIDASGRVDWRREAVSHARDLLTDEAAGGPFDAVVLTAGAATKTIGGLETIPLTPCRGQNVFLRPKSSDSVAFPFPVLSGKYLVPDFFGAGGGEGQMIAGATFEYCPEDVIERDFILSGGGPADGGEASGRLKEALGEIVPGLRHYWEGGMAQSGLRALPPRSPLGSIPLAGKLQGVPGNREMWVLGGLGSRGLLHHAYLGKLVAQAVVAGNEKLVPGDARRIVMRLGE